MKSKLTKYGLMIIAAVLLVAVAFSGAASADAYVKVWNGTALQSMTDGQSISGTLGGYANLTGAPGTTDPCVLELNNFNVGSVADPVSSTIISAYYVPNLTIKLVGESNLIGTESTGNGLILCTNNLTITSTDSGNGKLLVNNTISSDHVRSIYTSSGSLTINGGVNITAIAFGTDDVYPIYSDNGISISGENTVVNLNATASTGTANGLYTSKSISIKDGANVTAIAQSSNGIVHALDAGKGLVISGTDTVVYAKASSGVQSAFAIYGMDNISLKSAKKITAIGTNNGGTHPASSFFCYVRQPEVSGLATGYIFSNATNPGEEPTSYSNFSTNWARPSSNWMSNYTAVTIERILGPTPIDYEVTIINATGTHHLTNQSDTVIGDNGYAKATKVGDVVVLTLNNFKQNLATNDPIIVSATPNLKIVLNGESNLTGCYSNNLGGLINAWSNLTIATENGGKLIVNNTNTTSTADVYSIYVRYNLTIEDGANVTAISNGNHTTYALYSEGNFSIVGAKVTATGNSTLGDISTIHSDKSLVITDSAVTAKAIGYNDFVEALVADTIVVSGENTIIDANATQADIGSSKNVAYAFIGYDGITITSAKKITAIASSLIGNASSFVYNENDGARDFSGLATGYTFSNATNPGSAPTSYAVFNDSNNWHNGYNGEHWENMVSNYTAVTIEKGSTPAPYTPSSSSKHSGSTVILSEGQTAPTAYATAAPTVAPTVKPTEKPATPTVIATAAPTTQPTETQKSPAPVIGIIAGLGAAAVLLRMRK